MTQPFSLKGKRACITGASKGIGLGIARSLGEAGANLTLAARGEAALEEARVALSGLGVEIATVSFDLSRTKDISTWFSESVCMHGAPDILVNNAGIAKRMPAEELPLDEWENLLAINMGSVFALSQAFARERFAAGKAGSIVNVSSVQALASRYGTAAYCATKGGVSNLTKGLAVDWAKKGIRVNAVAPGFIDTPMTEGLRATPLFDGWVKERCPMGRWGEPSDIGGPVVFLASEAACFVTGQTLYVDGGWTSSL